MYIYIYVCVYDIILQHFLCWLLTPISFPPTLAGGQAVDSQMRRMLEVVPESIHDRSGIFMGSYDEVEKVKRFHM